MSHLKERTEKTCLNCRAELNGRFCHVCGQENVEPKETVWHLVQHFFNDITHFDGKFFMTVKDLLKRPGFLSKEYMLGRRASYLNPIRMYVFSSAIFFLLLFSLGRMEDMVHTGDDKEEKVEELRWGIPQLDSTRGKLIKQLAEGKVDADDVMDTKNRVNAINLKLLVVRHKYGDSSKLRFTRTELNDLLLEAARDSIHAIAGLPKRIKDSLVWQEQLRVSRNNGNDAHYDEFRISNYRTVANYDSVQKSLPAERRDDWLTRAWNRKLVQAQEEIRRDKKKWWEHFAENLLHSIPKILFVSLPLFAMILNILYFRRKKTFYYVSHGIFTIHVYCATFILGMAIILLNKLSHLWDTKVVSIVTGLGIAFIVIYMMIYLYKAMRGFYGQGRAKTFLKYLMVCFIATIINTILLVIFILISAISI